MTYRVRTVLALISAALLAGCASLPDLPKRHAIAAANPHAAEAGREMLRAGGSAVDAAIAAQLVLTLVEPQSSGIGGGAFLLLFSPGEVEKRIPPELHAYEGREAAPAAVTLALFLDANGKPFPRDRLRASGLSIGVPGVIRMMEMAHAKHGRLPWARLFAPAIRLAENGFEISPRLHNAARRYTKYLKRDAASRAYFFTPGGDPLRIGHVLRNPALADTLRKVAADGAKAFHEGDIARDIVHAVQQAPDLPGGMTEADLRDYKAKERRVVCGPYRRWTICGFGPPTTGGIAVLQILSLLEPFDLARLGPDDPQALHLIAEASRLAFADRNRYVADSDFIDVPVDGLLDRDYLAERARRISGLRSMGRAQPGAPRGANDGNAADTEPKAPSTSHLSVIDDAGNAVAMTTSVALSMGAKIMARGFILNSQLTDFAFHPTRDGRKVVNRAAPGKRPRSSQSPTLVLDKDGRLVMTVGSPGGTSIIGYVVKAIIGVLDWNLTMQQAIDLPNIVNRNRSTDLERGTLITNNADSLRALGHEVRIRSLESGLHGLRVTPNGIDGGADPRREGVVLGD